MVSISCLSTTINSFPLEFECEFLTFSVSNRRTSLYIFLCYLVIDISDIPVFNMLLSVCIGRWREKWLSQFFYQYRFRKGHLYCLDETAFWQCAVNLKAKRWKIHISFSLGTGDCLMQHDHENSFMLLQAATCQYILFMNDYKHRGTLSHYKITCHDILSYRVLCKLTPLFNFHICLSWRVILCCDSVTAWNYTSQGAYENDLWKLHTQHLPVSITKCHDRLISVKQSSSFVISVVFRAFTVQIQT